MLYREIIAVCSQIHTKHTNTLCGQNAECLNVILAAHKAIAGLSIWLSLRFPRSLFTVHTHVVIKSHNFPTHHSPARLCYADAVRLLQRTNFERTQAFKWSVLFHMVYMFCAVGCTFYNCSRHRTYIAKVKSTFQEAVNF